MFSSQRSENNWEFVGAGMSSSDGPSGVLGVKLATELADKVETEVGAHAERLEQDMKLSRRSVFNGKLSGSDRCAPKSSTSVLRRELCPHELRPHEPLENEL